MESTNFTPNYVFPGKIELKFIKFHSNNSLDTKQRHFKLKINEILNENQSEPVKFTDFLISPASS